MGTRPEQPLGRARVGYLGPAGTFSEEALLASALPEAIEAVAMAGIYDTVVAVRDGAVEWGIVPIENSLEGSINLTLDLLAQETASVRIVGEALLRVRHSLIAAEPVAIEEIDTVLTHPQVPGQCTRILRGELHRARILPANSTAEAVRTVADGRQRGQAAIGTALAAEIYGAEVIREGIEDRADNETRFVWIASADASPDAPPMHLDEGGEWKTSLVFWGAGAERPGWLVQCLSEFAEREINLTKIESRPRRRELGSYMFFTDLCGHAEDRQVADAIAGIAGICEQVLVLGSYRSAPARAAERAQAR